VLNEVFEEEQSPVLFLLNSAKLLYNLWTPVSAETNDLQFLAKPFEK